MRKPNISTQQIQDKVSCHHRGLYNQHVVKHIPYKVHKIKKTHHVRNDNEIPSTIYVCRFSLSVKMTQSYKQHNYRYCRKCGSCLFLQIRFPFLVYGWVLIKIRHKKWQEVITLLLLYDIVMFIYTKTLR